MTRTEYESGKRVQQSRFKQFNWFVTDTKPMPDS